jgi:hypothetical protein
MEAEVPSLDSPPDDDALLREALAFIGDLGGDVDDLSLLDVDIDAGNDGLWSPLAELQLDSDTVQVPPVAEPESDAPSPLVHPTGGAYIQKADCTYSQRRKELLYLHEMVGDLKSKLSQLKRQCDEQQLLEAPSGEARMSLLVRAAWNKSS